jgi:predicted lipoprotein with Yx(FWY)xxD motif
MVRMRMTMVLGAVLFALVLASCSNGSTNDSSGGQAAGGGQATGAGAGDAMSGSGGATVAVADGDLGKMLVDADGRTLYLFLADTGSTSTCAGDCASTWPALTVTGKPTAADGVDAAMLGTSKRPDGGEQVTFDGHPLYTFSGDSAAGDTNGEGIGGVWYVVSPDGTPIKQAGGGSGGKY